jgi:hypothetical protein
LPVSFRLSSRGVRFAKQTQEFVIESDVDRHLGIEIDRIVVLAPEARHFAQQLLRDLLVADEVVIDDEDLMRAEAMALADLSHHLLDALHARLPPVHGDDVAELAVEGATARELDGKRVVAVDLEQVETRHGRVAEVRLLGCAVLALRHPGLEVPKELRPGLLGLFDEERVTATPQLIGEKRGEGTTDHHEAPAAAELLDDLQDARAMDGEAGHADDVRLEIEIDLLHVLVEEHHLVLGRSEARHGGHGEVGEEAIDVEGGKNRVVGPVARGIPGRNQQDSHGRCAAPPAYPPGLARFFGRD